MKNNKPITVRDVLYAVDFGGGYCIFWDYEDNSKDPVWEGHVTDIPYWLAETKLDYSDNYEPVCYCRDLGEEYDHKSGFAFSIIFD